jgi:hypothetical protein
MLDKISLENKIIASIQIPHENTAFCTTYRRLPARGGPRRFGGKVHEPLEADSQASAW